MRHLNLDQLITFRTIADTGGFTAAARRLHLSQSAVSVQIRELEARLGVALLDRIGKTAIPTAAGRELLTYTATLHRTAEDAERAMKRHRDGWLGLVRIGASTTAMIYHLPRALAELRREHPTLELHLTGGTTSTISDQLARDDVDIGVVSLPLNVRGLRITPLFKENLVAILPAQAADIPAVVTAKTLRDFPLLLESGRAHVKLAVVEWLTIDGIAPRAAMELDNLEVITRMVAAGLGVSVVPYSAVEGRERDGQLLVKPLRPVLHRKLVIAQRTDRPVTPAIKAVTLALQKLSRS
jgi:DNA-binding transcriptional LysR family regulator